MDIVSGNVCIGVLPHWSGDYATSEFNSITPTRCSLDQILSDCLGDFLQRNNDAFVQVSRTPE